VKVHLAARSEHFCAMLYGGMRESTCKEIEIKGVSYEVFLAMLEFLYTDTVSDISPRWRFVANYDSHNPRKFLQVHRDSTYGRF